MPATPLATITDVTDVAGAIPTADVARIEGLIAKVSAQVRRYTGHAFTIGVVADEVATVYPHDGQVRLPDWPVTAVASVVAGSTPVAANVYEWTANGVLRIVPLASSPVWPNWSPGYSQEGWATGPLVVTYSHGYDAVPDDVALVVAEKVAEKYRNGGGGAVQSHSESIDGYSEATTYDTTVAVGGWSAEHKEILDGYRRRGLTSLRLG